MRNSDHDFTMPPFPGFPSVSRYVPIGPVADALSRVVRSVAAHEAISLVIGPPGTGKSLLCGLLAKHFLESHDVVVLGETSIADEASFQKFLLHRLGVPLETNRPQNMDLMLDERLTGPSANPHGLVLIIDEAASLTQEVLETIRRATNIMRDGQPMVSAVIAGGVQLDDTLTLPAMESFVQRVSARCYLHPLNQDETREYIHAAIRSCDADPGETIAEEAVSAIHHATGGIARLINQMMTEAIDCAAEQDEAKIDERIISQAWSNLQQLPSPIVDEPELQGECSVVEFGQLSEEAPSELESSARATIDVPGNEPLAIDSDIDSIQWIDEGDAAENELTIESAEPSLVDDAPAERSPDPIELFGEFDSEENIDVGLGEDHPQGKEPSYEIESMLHSEIVSLSHFAAENTTFRGQTDIAEVPGDIENLLNGEAEKREEFSDPTSLGNDAPELEQDDDGVQWFDEPADEPETRQATPFRDDSDLLWITEDIDVDPRKHAGQTHRIDGAEAADAPKLNVDYRELLEKMRKLS